METLTTRKNIIAPYSAKEVQAALVRLANSRDFIKGVNYFLPNWTKEQIIANLNKCHNCADFEIIFVEPIIGGIIKKSIDKYEIIGLDKITKTDSYLCISNHRDILLDAGLLQYSLLHHGLPFTEISLGDNLIMNELIETVAKMNNMFTVYRSGSRMELLQNAQNLSAYLRHTITEKKVSAWIAQGNGRTKDGHDTTFPGLVNMLLMSGSADYQKSLEALNIMVASISYEYEPCAFEKAIELDTIENIGSYTKAKQEDLKSILSGINAYKGNVRLVLERLDTQPINFSGKKKEVINSISETINQTVYKNYRLWKTNYMAFDIIHQTNRHHNHYNEEDLLVFKSYLHQSNQPKTIVERVLKIYATPVINKLKKD